MKHQKHLSLLACLLLLVLTGCGGGGGDTNPPGGPAKWTVLVYINAANSLDSYANDDINEMEQIGSTDQLNIVVQVKRRNVNFQNTRRMLIGRDNQPEAVTSPVIQDLGPGVDMGDWQTLKSFVEWGIASYPSERVAVILWNHGDGWRSRTGVNPITKAISEDDLTGNHIEVWQLAQALRPLDTSRVLDVLAFDACYMQMAEVAQEVRLCTQYICGSEEFFPGEGYPYELMLAPLRDTPTIGARVYATVLVNQIFAGLSYNGSITQSALDASAIPTLTAKIDSFAGALMSSTITKDEANVVRTQAQSYVIPENKDLIDYAKRMAALRPTDASLQAAYLQLSAAVAASVVNEKHTNDAVKDSHGVAIYVPSRLDFNTKYLSTAFSRATRWDEWIQSQGQ